MKPSTIAKNGTPVTSEPLNTAGLRLHGRHLIEASAGTGKTYNITKLYVRLLLEKPDLTVQNILVMTFTKAATEELRGRIEKEVRGALETWGKEADKEPFYQLLEAQFATELDEKKQRLQSALLDLDEASIYTIHGFCSRVLTQEAFASGLPMELVMEADTHELLLETTRDWFRRINQDQHAFALLQAKNWHTPQKFYRVFKALLTTEASVDVISHDTIIAENPDKYGTIIGRKSALLASLKSLDDLAQSHFINKKKGHETLRSDAWASLIEWLAGEDERAFPKTAAPCLNWGLITKTNPLRQHLEPVRSLRDDAEAFNSLIEDIPAVQLAADAVNEIRAAFHAAKSTQAVMDFDDLITHLRKRLQSDHGDKLAQIIRHQYPFALVDEFQDTDPDQYAILDRLYPRATENHALFMIGDPKQAIYSFRGGDVFAYLKARDQADYKWHMDTNWRSLKEVVNGYNRIFFGRALDEQSPEPVFGNNILYDKINYSPRAEAVKSPIDDPERRYGAINFVWLPVIKTPTGSRGAVKDDWLQGLTRWCVSEIHRLLSDVTLGQVPVKEKDIAILVRTGTEAKIFRECLAKAGYPSVYLSDRTNVFNSAEAVEISSLLQGILESENDRLLISAVSTRLWGGDANTLAELQCENGEEAWEATRSRAIALRLKWRQQGCMKMLLGLLHGQCLPDPTTHERSLTNYLHIMERLQHASRQYKHPQQLLKWYRDQCLNPALSDDAEQRLESDANLIRILTQHSSKGLEYPIVFVPYASTYKDPAKAGRSMLEYFKFHDPETYNTQYQLGQSDTAIRLVQEEGHAESIRLFYVAVTRASHRCYIGVAPIKGESERSSLGLALKVEHSDQWPERLEQLVETPGDCNRLITIDSETPLPETPINAGDTGGTLKKPCRIPPIEDNWRLVSYSSLKKLTRQDRSVRQDQKDRDDESGGATITDDSAEPVSSTTQPLPLRFRLKKGAAAGDLLHDILEHTHFSSPDWAVTIEQPLHRFDPKANYSDELQSWLDDCLDASVPVIGDENKRFKLRELAWEQTLRESEFYYSMDQVNPVELEEILQAHRGTRQRINISQVDRLLSGMMHGFIDLIFEYDGRFYIADYKSTHLGNRIEDYAQASIEDSIRAQFYDLQYLIYSLALHRYLGTALGDDYHPKKQFGGVYYFYLRGMTAGQDDGYGIYPRQITLEELQALDRLFGHNDQDRNPQEYSA